MRLVINLLDDVDWSTHQLKMTTLAMAQEEHTAIAKLDSPATGVKHIIICHKRGLSSQVQ